MKKRLLCLLLAVILLFSAVPSVQASGSLCFVAMNDTIPLTLKGNAVPYYSNSRLYLPYTAFNISPNGVGASYNVEKNTFVLYNANETLIFDLENDTYTDKKDKVYDVDVVFRSGVLYVPEKVIKHFGLSVTLLFSRADYPIIRFTNGEQVYDDGTFVAQAENLITRAAQEYEAELAAQNPGPGTVPEDPVQEPEEQPGPVVVYLAFCGEAVSQKTLDLLNETEMPAAFFLTEEEILADRDLIRSIYAAGHTIGITVNPGETDYQAALVRANDALDQVLFFRSVLALLPAGAELEMESLHILQEPPQKTIEELLDTAPEPQFYIVKSGAPGVISSLSGVGASVLRLRETTF